MGMNKPPIMRNNLFWHITSLIAMLLVTYVMVPQSFQGKHIMHGDKLQNVAMKRDVKAHFESTGQLANWTDRAYSGMPSTLIMGVYPGNWPKEVLNGLVESIQKPEVVQLLWPMICLYVALSVAGYSAWLSLLGALAFGLSTINIGNIDAGHSTKIMATSASVAALIGLWLLFKSKYLKGLFLITLFGAFAVAANHLQITYYTLLLGIIIAIAGTIRLIRKGQPKVLAKILGLVTVSAVICLLPNVSMLWSNYDYGKETVRGRRILQSSDQPDKGLTKDYSSVFSHDFMELGSLFIPRLVGGGDKELLTDESKTFEAVQRTGLLQNRVSENSIEVPLYWGDKPLNEAPTYIGLVLFVLFICSLFMVGKGTRTISIAMVVFSVVVAMGSHLGFINTLIFENLPFFNRFRAPSMILGLTAGVMAWTVVAGLSRLIQDPHQIDAKKKKLSYTFGSIALVCLFFAVIGPSFFDFTWDAGKETYGIGIDENLQNQLLNAGAPTAAVMDLMEAIRKDRTWAMRSDSFRSLVFLVLLGLLAYGFYKKRLSQQLFVGGLAALLVIDLIQVNKRYLNDRDFESKELVPQQLQPSQSDVSIARLRFAYDRVLDLSGSPWTDGKPSYFHPNIGGNHAAKLRRYQDLIDFHLDKEVTQIRAGNKVTDVPALNMLNMRFIKAGYGPKAYLENVTSLGFAWFVDSIGWVNTPDEEIMKIGSLDGAAHAIVHNEFKPQLSDLSTDSSSFSKLELTYKAPGKVVYNTSTDKERLMVMSEIWYKGNEYWKSYIDDEPVDHIRVNYLLRGIVVPAGVHSIRFEYNAVPFQKGEPISKAGSALWVIALIGVTFLQIRQHQGQPSTDTNT